jgi:hypothetical protein
MGKPQCEVLEQIHKGVIHESKRRFGPAERAAEEAAHKAREERGAPS